LEDIMATNPSIRVKLPMPADDFAQLLAAIGSNRPDATVEVDDGAYDIIIRRSQATDAADSDAATAKVGPDEAVPPGEAKPEEAGGTALAQLRETVEQTQAEIEGLRQAVAEAQSEAEDALAEVEGLRAQIERGDFS
jgi:hypothetical protein